MHESDSRRIRHEIYYARKMRREPAKAEHRLWQALRRKTFGVRFRRQQPIGPFIVDFYCSPARLIIELDGAHHETEPKQDEDADRTRWLEANGYRVLRFCNGEVTSALDDVLERIRRALRERGALGPRF